MESAAAVTVTAGIFTTGAGVTLIVPKVIAGGLIGTMGVPEPSSALAIPDRKVSEEVSKKAVPKRVLARGMVKLPGLKRGPASNGQKEGLRG